jgi:outer membrane protein OmpA-like peptidoglycan-associated protein
MAAKQTLSRATFVEIVGYTDDVADDDLELSPQRAASVRVYLLSKGLDRNKGYHWYRRKHPGCQQQYTRRM